MVYIFSITNIQWKTSKNQLTFKILKMDNNREKQRKREREGYSIYFNKLYFSI